MQRWLSRFIVACLACACGGVVSAEGSTADSAAALHAKYTLLRDELNHSPFDRPLHLESAETSDQLKGEVHALVSYPFPAVSAALKGANRWCDILKFDYRVAAEAPDYFRLVLNADTGPFGTRNYRIVLEAVPVDRERTFLHMSYGYGYGVPAKIAMQTYLRTAGSQKVGFTVTERRADGQPVRVDGLRGALERNVMRYYLAIDAYLAASAAPPQDQLEERLRDWFESTERYALQLHEVDQNEYLEMKRRECALQASQP